MGQNLQASVCVKMHYKVQQGHEMSHHFSAVFPFLRCGPLQSEENRLWKQKRGTFVLKPWRISSYYDV